MKTKSVLILLALIFTGSISGCTSAAKNGNHSNMVSPSQNRKSFVTITMTNYVTAPAPLEYLKTRNGLSLRDARDSALKLETATTTKEEVSSLFGEPDETSGGVYGTQTANPWNGMMWYYRWTSQDPNSPGAELTILLQQNSDGSWVVNSWHWN